VIAKGTGCRNPTARARGPQTYATTRRRRSLRGDRQGHPSGAGLRGFTVAAEAADTECAIRAVLRERPDECPDRHQPAGRRHPGGGGDSRARARGRDRHGRDGAGRRRAVRRPGSRSQGSLLRDIAPTALGNALRGIMRGEAAIPPPPSSPGSSQSSALAARRAAVARSAARSTV
jgi:hypothetical protein